MYHLIYLVSYAHETWRFGVRSEVKVTRNKISSVLNILELQLRIKNLRRDLQETAEVNRDEKRKLRAILDGNLPGWSTLLAVRSICTVCTGSRGKDP